MARTEKKVGHRSWIARSAKMQNGAGPMKDRRDPRGGNQLSLIRQLDEEESFSLDQETDEEEEEYEEQPNDRNEWFVYFS